MENKPVFGWDAVLSDSTVSYARNWAAQDYALDASRYLVDNTAWYLKPTPTFTYGTSILDFLKEKPMKEKNKNFVVNGVWFKTLKKAKRYAEDLVRGSSNLTLVKIAKRIDTVQLAVTSNDD